MIRFFMLAQIDAQEYPESSQLNKNKTQRKYNDQKYLAGTHVRKENIYPNKRGRYRESQHANGRDKE